MLSGARDEQLGPEENQNRSAMPSLRCNHAQLPVLGRAPAGYRVRGRMSLWRPLLRLVMGCLASSVSCGFAALVEAPVDARLLVEDVIRRRLATPPLLMEIEITRLDGRGQARRVYEVLVDGGKRRFRSLGPSDRAGRAAYDGQALYYYHPHPGVVERRKLEGFADEFVFDPRTLGLNHYWLPQIGVEDTLPIAEGGHADVIGRARVGGWETWHLRIRPGRKWRFPDGYLVECWIDGRGRVRRYWQNGVTVESDYDKDIPGGLPSTVHSVGNPSGQRDARTVCVIQKIVSLPGGLGEEEFSIGGLDVPMGTPVHDLSLKKRIGFWDGSRVIEGVGDAALAATVAFDRRAAWVTLAVMFLLLVGGGVWFVKAWRRSGLSGPG